MQALNVFVYGGGPASALISDYTNGSLRRECLVSRQSLISAMNGRSTAEVGSVATLRPDELRVLNGDLMGSLPTELRRHASSTDIVLVDLFDERFGVDLMEDGSYITRSPARVKHVTSGARLTRTIAFGSDEHFDLWASAADEFLELLSESGLLTLTFLLDVAWAHADEEGLDAELTYGLSSDEANRVFRRYVDHMRKAGVQIVNQSATRTSRHHKWSPAPFNFHDGVYHEIAAKLVKAILNTPTARRLADSVNWDDRHQAPIVRWTSQRQFDPRIAGRTHHMVAADSSMGQKRPLRCLIQRGESDTLLVISHGALARRKYSLPRFEWLATLEHRSENLMFLADTALEPFDELELAWFTGDANDDLTHRYSDLVSTTAALLGASKILLLGGSGGGFASLALSAHLPGTRVLAFNPQTNIRKYWNKSVRHYAELLFPEFDSINQLNGLGPRTNVVRSVSASIESDTQFIYIQNDDDEHHIDNHLKPFAAALGMAPQSEVSRDGNVKLVVEHFATGHNMPYRQVLNPFIDLALADWDGPLQPGFPTWES